MTRIATIGPSALRQGTEDGQAVNPSFASKRLAREWQTITAMIHCYCHGHHATGKTLCSACQELLDYAGVRLDRCRFGSAKPVCVKCPVHCYQRARREQIREVMRYAGPRMLWQHPILSLRHWLDAKG
jgi:hypothetical protein